MAHTDSDFRADLLICTTGLKRVIDHLSTPYLISAIRNLTAAV